MVRLATLAAQLRRDVSGVNAIEYSLLVMVVAIALIALQDDIGQTLKGILADAGGPFRR